MREQHVAAIKAAASTARKSFDVLLASLRNTEDESGAVFDISKPIPGTDTSISDIASRLVSMEAFSDKLDVKGATLTPQAVINSFVGSSGTFVSQVAQLESTLKGSFPAGNTPRAFNYDNLQIVTTQGTVYDFLPPFKAVYDASESLLGSFQQCFQSINPSRAAFNYGAAAESLSKQVEANNEQYSKLRSLVVGGQEALAKLTSAQEALAQQASQSQRSSSEIEALKATATAAIAEIENNRAQAETLATTARTLKSTVEEYQAAFVEFDKKLNDRETNYRRGRDKLNGLITKFEEQGKSFATLIEKSEQMLSSATVAGLASEFGTLRTDLTAEVKEAHRALKWSIGILIASAIPLLLFIFAPIIAPLISSDDKVVAAIAGAAHQGDGLQYLGQVLARLVILLPAAWYVAFCTSRYNSLFRLREHYAYKYSMAVSVEGFKKQAPGYEDMIAALVLEQLAFNPADKLKGGDDHDGKPPNPILRLFVDRLGRRLEDKAADGQITG